MADRHLDGQRILLLEEQDEAASLIAEMIRELGGEVIGPTNRIAEALRLLVAHEVDGALLDVKIEGEATTAVAEDLIRRGIPWAFASGNRQARLARRYPQAPILRKPFATDQLGATLRDLLDRADRSAEG